MNMLEKAQENLEDKDIWTSIENNTLYVIIGDTKLELAEFEIEYQAKEYDNKDEEE